MPTTSELCVDLAAETAELRALVADLDEAGWDLATPAPGWSIRDQLTHLAHFDDVCRTTMTHPEEFRATRGAATDDIDAFVERVAAEHRSMSGAEVLDWFDRARAALIEVARRRPAGERVPWYGPDMSVASAVTARMMETWAHGQDVADALGRQRPATDRLRHVAFLGARALPHSFRVHGREPPARTVRLELDMPGGRRWTLGPDDADEVVTGPLLDFCLLVCRRRHLDDTALRAGGPTSAEWLAIAQAYAGPPGPGRRPRGERP